uniref:Uncharacterized protein n=1 Tax=Lepeophtheirus salmonis TaxID=72036 RepID=A0A0K2UKZ1_LEPSM
MVKMIIHYLTQFLSSLNDLPNVEICRK